MIQESRIRRLNDAGIRPAPWVLYWMQQSQRADGNHALEYAIDRANELGLPVVVVFGLMPGYPEANRRHYAFMIEGLRETSAALARRGIAMAVRVGAPDDVALALAGDAALLVTDRGYLRHQRAWRTRVAREAPCAVVQVETDVVVPVETASHHEEYAARTLRPKVVRLLPDYLVPLPARPVRRDSLALNPGGENLSEDLPARLGLNTAVEPVTNCKGGASEAERRLAEFLNHKLDRYADSRNDPAGDWQSGLSPYLHFGQISPLDVALAVMDRAAGAFEASAEAFLEELIVRRELAVNFVHYNPDYDRFEALPDWARQTLRKHRHDRRDPLYDAETLEAGRTHDPYWNAAMAEMRNAGKMHGYMRMYWGKKILEWSSDPESAYETALALNNKYFLDGRDPSSYANIAWVFGKHDRPWKERPISGTVRYMNARGLDRKFNMPAYLKRVT